VGVCVKSSIVSIAYSVLLLLLRATGEGGGFIWLKRGLFKAGRKKKI
jgi:hypothetical protein